MQLVLLFPRDVQQRQQRRDFNQGLPNLLSHPLPLSSTDAFPWSLHQFSHLQGWWKVHSMSLTRKWQGPILKGLNIFRHEPLCATWSARRSMWQGCETQKLSILSPLWFYWLLLPVFPWGQKKCYFSTAEGLNPGEIIVS